MKQCSNCGTTLNEEITTCPNCGANIVKQNPKKDKDIRKILIPVISILIIVLLGVMVYSVALKSNDNKKNKPDTNQNVEPNEENENNGSNQVVTNTIEYAGYRFTLLDGFSTITSNIYGLIIYNSEIAYTIGIDYTNNYDMYKNAFINYAPQLESSLFTSFSDNEYLIYNIVDTDLKGSQYETRADDNTTFTGLIVKKDYTLPTSEELSPISNFILSAEKISDTDLKGTSSDFGTNVGIIVYQINPDEFPFQNSNIEE